MREQDARDGLLLAEDKLVVGLGLGLQDMLDVGDDAEEQAETWDEFRALVAGIVRNLEIDNGLLRGAERRRQAIESAAAALNLHIVRPDASPVGIAPAAVAYGEAYGRWLESLGGAGG